MPTDSFNDLIASQEGSSVKINRTDNGFTARLGEFGKTENELAIKYEKGIFGGKPEYSGFLKISPDEVFYFNFAFDAARKPRVSAGYAKRSDPETSNYVDFPTYPNSRDNRALYFLNLDESSENGDRWNQILDLLSDEGLTKLLEENNIQWDTKELNIARAKTEEPAKEASDTTTTSKGQEEQRSDLPFEVLPHRAGDPLIIKTGDKVWYLSKQTYGNTMTYQAYIYDPGDEEKYTPAIWHVELPLSEQEGTSNSQLMPRINLHELGAPLILEGNPSNTYSLIINTASKARPQFVQLEEAASVQGDLGVRFNNLAHRGLELMRVGDDVVGKKIDEMFTNKGLPNFRSNLIRALPNRAHYQS